MPHSHAEPIASSTLSTQKAACGTEAVALPLDCITLKRPDDLHVHLRDGDMLGCVVGHTARQFGRALVMPNLNPPVTTTAQAGAYRERIMAALFADTSLNPEKHALDFQPLMSLYLTESTSAQEIERAHNSGWVHAVKLYPAGATTHSDAGVRDLSRCTAVLETMQKLGMPLLVHGEVTDPQIDLFDREKVFLETVMIPLRRDFPELKVVFEHITTQEVAQYVEQASAAPGTLGATITAHHLLYNRNAIFQNGIQPHYYCLPVLKREVHRQALIRAATSGNPRFFLGTDSAPHDREAKERACGCAGCYTAFHALELYAEAFEAANALHRLEGFASEYGALFYGLPMATQTVTLRRQTWTLPETLKSAQSTLIPLRAGGTLAWKIDESVNN